MQRECVQPFEYPSGRMRTVGEVFEVDPQDAQLLSTLGWVKAPEGYETREMTAAARPQYQTRELRSKRKQ